MMRYNHFIAVVLSIYTAFCWADSTTIDPAFPYGSVPNGNVCVTADYYAPPESLLGSWAMIEAVALDSQSNVLPSMLTSDNVVYAVGTAAIGARLGLSNCSGGCNDLNGMCYALKFNDKNNYPYMIFQSVNIGANADTFDIYMAGGGSGAFPTYCAKFWGTDASVNWSANIENSDSCETYFNNYSSIQSNYAVTYAGVTHTAKETLMGACNFASAAQTGFNVKNWSNVTVVPVECPESLTQITGVRISSAITTKIPIHALHTLTEEDFTNSNIKNVTTTQMQDCKTPSSGYCGNVKSSVDNYNASISASITTPLLTGQPLSNTYCQSNPSITGYCSWNNGESSGSAYCNQSESICHACGNASKWCTCSTGQLVQCTS